MSSHVQMSLSSNNNNDDDDDDGNTSCNGDQMLHVAIKTRHHGSELLLNPKAGYSSHMATTRSTYRECSSAIS